MSEPVKKRAKRVQYPQHNCRFEVIEAVLEADAALSSKLHRSLDVLCELREILRQKRIEDRTAGRATKAAGDTYRYLTKNDLYRFVSELVAREPQKYAAVHSQVLQDVVERIELGTKAWLKGIRGALCFLPRKRYRSLTFTQYGFAAKIKDGRLHLSKLGQGRLIGLRRLPGRVKGVTLVFKQGRWFAQFRCEIQAQHCPRAQRNASSEVQQLPDNGLDTGVASVATLASGESFEPCKPLRAALGQLKGAQRKMARQFEQRKAQAQERLSLFKLCGHCGPLPEKDIRHYSNRLKAQIKVVARVHTRAANIRRDQLRKLARRIEATNRCVAVEEHGIKFMQANRKLARAVSDVAPAMFKNLLKTALGAGRYVPVGNRRPGIGGNSQTCLCGVSVPKALGERWHTCPDCGLSAPRDQVSANIAMHIAFTYSYLGEIKAPALGQSVRRGESKCQRGQPRAAAQKKSRETAAAPEDSVKRHSIAELGSARSAGAKATTQANNLPLLGAARAAPLSG